MNQQTLSSKQRQALKAQAHALKPVVIIGQNGLTDAVVREADIALKAHELIKIRVRNDDRNERIEFAQTFCERLNAQLVAHSGKLIILWRKNEE
ncbi:MAG: ribosome assembly RNA-binding protein YhbY [Neisseriaceae bacterium]|nr:ribosome assembly RNA-binding protein YhbY [Neisseriaceae bacterium]MBR3425679.1 ribosome assembly RNA-binding protein YhbY [Neisseriaceae bacterium]